jgi:hypothetical protein
MKKITLTLTITILTVVSFAQMNPKYTKLQELFDAGKYEDCAYKAENFTLNDKTKKDAEPYLFLTKCNYQIYSIGGKEDEYPKAFDDAFKHAAKFRSKDKDGSLYAEHKSYFNDLKVLGVKDAYDFYRAGSYSKAASSLKKIIKFNEDPLVMFMLGVSSFLSNNDADGTNNTNAAIESLTNIKTPFELTDIEKLFAIDTFIDYSDYLVQKEDSGKAKEMLEIALNVIDEKTKIQLQLEKLTN